MTSSTLTHQRTPWRIIAFYMLAFAAGGVVQPFLNLYLVEIGLSAARIGVLHGYAALAAVIIAPLIGFLADRTQRHRLFLGIITTIKGLMPPLMLISSAWWWLVATVSTRVVTAGVSDGLLSPLTMRYLRARGQQNIGGVRVWGALSFAASSLLAGWLAGDGSVSVLFPLAGLLGVLAFPFVAAFPSRIAESHMPTHTSWSSLWPVRSLLLLYGLSALYSFSYSGPEVFANVYLVQKLGASNQLIGLMGALLWLAPLAGYRMADALIRWSGGAGTMIASFLLLALAWAGYALIPSPIMALPFVICQGLGHAVYVISLIVMMTSLGKANRASTDLLMVMMTVPGLARMVAQPLSGLIYDALGSRYLFSLDAALILAAAIFLWVVRKKLITGATADEG